ncbi:histidinol-phosphate transaminase [Granulicella tundricola]|uniref:histidinol-phosphate transaminase n=1 Tax=Granulicella tundricola (strain ATCC BAA-1859 / DSM 23138 / MP5ACTX9) TaxID=1198114 RepID=E8X0A3_GRATM|nr:histidinol-phosphate transaminase [Granulicella tundricola]ADW70084.1 histidinol-phosphate aminotransferase [Granulicella tundricola MP5ACTX9]
MSIAEAIKTVAPRRAILEMPEYHPPLASRDALRLDFNENTFAPSPRVMERLQTITAEGLTKYPEREPVERIVATKFGLDSKQVLLTNGVDEAIHLLCVTFLEDDDEALIWTPGFFMYDVNIQLMSPGGLRKVQSDASMQFPRERFLAAITDKTKLIMIASPNNPTGATIPCADLLAIANAAPHAVLMVDEAYFHFHGETTMGDVGDVPNLIVARTFSKAYGLANLRVGMLAGDARLIGYLRKASSPYNVNGVALTCLPVALEDDAYIAWYVDQIRTGRERIMAGLDELGVSYFPSEANFVLMQIGEKHTALVNAMRQRGVLLRDRSADPGCDGFVRITVGIADQVTQGLAALKDSLIEINWAGPVAAHDTALEREYE